MPHQTSSGDENRCRSALDGKLNHSWLVSVGAALRFVELLQARQGGLGDKPEPVGAGATSGGLAAAGDQHHGPTVRRAWRGDADLAAPIFDDLTTHQRAQHRQHLVGHPAARGHVGAEVLVLLMPMSDAERVPHPSPADQVQHAHLFGEPDGVPQRNRHGGQQYRQSARPRRDRRGQHQRRRQVAVVGAVVLGQHSERRTSRLRPRAHVDGRAVEVGGRPGPIGRPHVEPEGEHQRRCRRPIDTSMGANLTFVHRDNHVRRRLVAQLINACHVGETRRCLVARDSRPRRPARRAAGARPAPTRPGRCRRRRSTTDGVSRSGKNVAPGVCPCFSQAAS